MNMKRFVKERNEAFTEFVQGDRRKLIAYCKKYGVTLPKNDRVLAGGIYKAVQQCTDIPDDVKQ